MTKHDSLTPRRTHVWLKVLVAGAGAGVAWWAWQKRRGAPVQSTLDETAATEKKSEKVADDEIVPIHDWIYHTMFGAYSIYFRIGGWRIHGRENIPMDGPVIIAPNHKSLLDPPLVGSSLPRIATTMGKIELFEKKHFGLKILGKVIQHMGTFPVRRGTADRRAIRRALQVLKDDGALVIFPEGTRTRTGELGPSELGIALIAHNAKAPVVPSYIKGTEGCFSYLQPKARLIKAEIFYGKPIFFKEEYARKGDRATLQKIADRIMEAIAELRAQAGDGTTFEDAKATPDATAPDSAAIEHEMKA
ncbi:MAG: 1-acyl-sn-glycerol-3-phosphate acyltransferase [Abditibacteriota bacterium]|nr:1-acyl-sn-glycerol-3-phosphate acyltransferase [Abditibacteriota bacterium]